MNSPKLASAAVTHAVTMTATMGDDAVQPCCCHKAGAANRPIRAQLCTATNARLRRGWSAPVPGRSPCRKSEGIGRARHA